MNKKTFLILFFFILGFFLIILISSKTYRVERRYVPENTTNMFQGRECPNLTCVADRFVKCQITSYANNGTYILIYGFVNNQCNIEVKKSVSTNCYLSKENLTIPMLNQLLGNDEKLENIVAKECQ